MHLANISVRNFRNFPSTDIPLSGNVVLLGENQVGKSNLLFAIRLVLDPTLPDALRHLKLSVLWPFAIVGVVCGQHALARYMQKIARWKAVDD